MATAGGSLATRDYCLRGPHMPPYFNRAFTQTTELPQYGPGGNVGLQQLVDVESNVTFPYFVRAPKGCSDNQEYHPDLTFEYLPTKWQQGDYRPIHFQFSTRDSIKDVCRSREALEHPDFYHACMYEQSPEFYQDDQKQSVQQVFNDRYL